MGGVELWARNRTSEDTFYNHNHNHNSMERDLGTLCKWSFFCFIFLVLLVLWLKLGDLSESNVYIQDVYIPAIDTNTTTGNGTAPFNASIFVDLKFHRKSTVFSEHYPESDLVVFYSHEIKPVAGYRVRAFDMGRHRTVHKMAEMKVPELPWKEAILAVSGGSTVELMVEFGEAHSVQRGYGSKAHVAVDASGHMVPKGPIKLYES